MTGAATGLPELYEFPSQLLLRAMAGQRYRFACIVYCRLVLPLVLVMLVHKGKSARTYLGLLPEHLGLLLEQR